VAPTRPRIGLFTLGGTIAMAGHGGTGVVTRLGGADLAAVVPGWDTVGDVDVHDLRAMPSAGLTFADVLDVLDAAGQAVSDGADGVVVTQGTDTLEETAYLLDLLWPYPHPIVLTGAMRNPTLAGPDGPANLLAAARVAGAPQARGLGALVVFADEVHAARRVRKTHATGVTAVASPDTGPLGHVIEGRVRMLAAVPRLAPLDRPDPAALAATVVPLHTVTLDDDGVLLHHLASGTVPLSGLVVAAFGAGHVPARLVPPLAGLAARVPVLLTSRTGSGSVLRATYGAPGSETDLAARGLLDGGLLAPVKARVLLRLLVAAGADRDAVAARVAAHV
jgi:L-asparaginase/Glu-tRNA(Gln) amidotransferase subunit D